MKEHPGGRDNRGSLQQCPVCEDFLLPHVMGKHLARKHGLSLEDLQCRQEHVKPDSQDHICTASSRAHSENSAKVPELRSNGSKKQPAVEQRPDSTKPTQLRICPNCGEPKHLLKACGNCGYSYIASLSNRKHVKPVTERKVSANEGSSKAELIHCAQCGTPVRRDHLAHHLTKAHPALVKKKSRKTDFDKSKAIARKHSLKKQSAITGERRATNKANRAFSNVGADKSESHSNLPVTTRSPGIVNKQATKAQEYFRGIPGIISCPICGDRIARGTLRAHKRSVHGEAPTASTGSKIGKKKVPRPWITMVSGGLPGLGKHR